MEYQILALVMLVGFYSIYAGKLIDQKKKGIQTDHLAKGNKNNTRRKLEFVLIIATYSMVIVEVISIALDLYLLNPTIRVLGIILGFIGVIVFGIAVIYNERQLACRYPWQRENNHDHRWHLQYEQKSCLFGFLLNIYRYFAHLF